MATKLFTDYDAAVAAKKTDYLLIHDGAGVKKIQKQDLFSEERIALEIANGTYDGLDLTVKFSDEIADMSGDPWAWIQSRLDGDNMDDLFIHDFIPFLCMGESHEAQIGGKDTYYKTGDSGHVVGHHIDFISRDCLSATVQFNTTNINNGNADHKNPFLASNLKAWLDSTVYPTLSANLKAVIKSKRILAPYRFTSGQTLTDDNSWGWEDFDKLWVPLETEIFDDLVWSTKGYGNGQAVQYPIFANSYKARMKGAGPGGDRAHWRTASASSGYSADVVYVNSGGASHTNYASHAIRVPVCFRLIKNAA